MTVAKLASLVVTGVFATMAAAGVAAAATVPALAGMSADGSTCFTLGAAGVVINNCSFNKTWFIPLQPTASGQITVSMGMFNTPQGARSQCRLVGQTQTLSIPPSAPSPFVGPSVFGAWQAVTVGPATLPVAGFIYVECNLPPGGALSNLTY